MTESQYRGSLVFALNSASKVKGNHFEQITEVEIAFAWLAGRFRES